MTDLKQRRVKAGLTQAELARRCRCSTNYMWSVEKGKDNPSDDMKGKIRCALGEKAIPTGERTEEERFFYELFCERYGGSRPIVLQRG